MTAFWEELVLKEPSTEKRFLKVLDEARKLEHGAAIQDTTIIRDTLLLACGDMLEMLYKQINNYDVFEFAKSCRFKIPQQDRHEWIELTCEEVKNIIETYLEYSKCHY